jgi:hypothetical protein
VACSCEHGYEPSGNFVTNRFNIGFSRTLLRGVSVMILQATLNTSVLVLVQFNTSVILYLGACVNTTSSNCLI